MTGERTPTTVAKILAQDNNVVDTALANETKLRQRIAELEAAARAAVKQHGACYGECPHDYDALAALERLVGPTTTTTPGAVPSEGRGQ